MKTYYAALIIILLAGCTHTNPPHPSGPDYEAIKQRISDRIIALKEKYPTLAPLGAAPPSQTGDLGLQHRVTWKLDDSTKPHSKQNARHPVYETDDAFWFHVQFYRGSFKGAAVHRPHRLGDLRVWLRYGYKKDPSVIASITEVIREEKAAFDMEFPGLSEGPG